MISIDKIYESVYVINKSKFLSFAYPIFNEQDCKGYLDDLNKKYADATHICFAYVLDVPKVEKCSDDGEPSGTAGKPLLELIKKRKLSNVLLVVIRYFGGIKLGAGGLVRAYTNSGNIALDLAHKIEIKEIKKYRISCDFTQASKVKNLIVSGSGVIKNIQYNENVDIEFLIENTNNLKDFELIEIGSEKVCL